MGPLFLYNLPRALKLVQEMENCRHTTNHSTTRILLQALKPLYQPQVILRGAMDILFCGRQNIAPTRDAVNKGNFIALPSLLAESEEHLNRHLQFGEKNCRYTFTYQLLEIIGLQ